MCVRVCLKGWAHSAQSALPFFTPVGKTLLSKTWLNGCVSLSLNLPPLPILFLPLAVSHVSTNHCFMLPSPPCSPAKREPLSPSLLPERRPQDTNRTWHPKRGWRWMRRRGRKKCTRSYVLLHRLASLFLFPKSEAYCCRVVGKRHTLT